MQMGETSALTRVEEAVPRFITAAEMYQLGLRCGMLDGDARTVSALLCSARAMFRSNQYSDAAQLLGHLVEQLSKKRHRSLAQKHLTEISLMAVRSIQ